jgi:(1->4)-alpha-D-glucan 1-alpha-D-glucosylmutase
MKWRRINRSRKVQLSDGRVAPDENEEYFLYQTIVGAWPLNSINEEEREDVVLRIQQYMEKALHEAKVNLSWLNPNPEYVDAMKAFVAKVLAPTHRGRTNLFWDSFQRFLPAVTFFGCMNSLTQLLLKLTAPGVPDIYQGQELWDFSLVDPDNRRTVDFDVRTPTAADLCKRFEAGEEANVSRELLADYRDGRVKMWVTMLGLNFRRQRQELFRAGSYLPLHAEHGREEHLIAFARFYEGDIAIIAAPRLSCTLMKGKEELPMGTAWGDMHLQLPSEVVGQRLRNIFTGERFVAGNSLLCRELFGSFPLALLALD